jgi:hypothetical protein
MLSQWAMASLSSSLALLFNGGGGVWMFLKLRGESAMHDNACGCVVDLFPRWRVPLLTVSRRKRRACGILVIPDLIAQVVFLGLKCIVFLA